MKRMSIVSAGAMKPCFVQHAARWANLFSGDTGATEAERAAGKSGLKVFRWLSRYMAHGAHDKIDPNHNHLSIHHCDDQAREQA